MLAGAMVELVCAEKVCIYEILDTYFGLYCIFDNYKCFILGLYT